MSSVKEIASENSYTIATNGNVTIRVNFAEPSSNVDFYANSWGLDENGWTASPYQAVNFNSYVDACETVSEWIDGQC